MTNGSNNGSYCNATVFLTMVDERLIGQLCSVTNQTLSAATLLTDSKLAAALTSASGDLESAALLGGRYTAEDLAGLQYNAAAKRDRIIADHAMTYVFDLRPSAEPEPGWIRRMERASAWLEQLANGAKIFGTLEAADAGHMTETEMTPDDLNRFRGQSGEFGSCKRYFGHRTPFFTHGGEY